MTFVHKNTINSACAINSTKINPFASIAALEYSSCTTNAHCTEMNESYTVAIRSASHSVIPNGTQKLTIWHCCLTRLPCIHKLWHTISGVGKKQTDGYFQNQSSEALVEMKCSLHTFQCEICLPFLDTAPLFTWPPNRFNICLSCSASTP